MSDDSSAQSRLNNALLISAEKSRQIAAAAQGAALSEKARLSEELRGKKAESEAARSIRDLQEKVRRLQDSLEEQNASLLEWMQSSEAFKRLSRHYGKTLGRSPEQVMADVFQNILDIAEEDKKYANTKGTMRAKQQLNR